MMQVNFPRVYLLEECLNTSIVPNVYCYENKDGSKKLVIRKTMKVHGKSQSFSKTVDVPFDCNSRRKLEKFASEQRNEFFKALENSESPELTKMTFSEYFEGPCQSYKSTREKTWNDYNSHYRRHMKDYFGEIKVSEINKVVVANYFKYLDQEGVGQLIKMAAEKGRATKPTLKMGICGEHGGDPSSVEFCHKVGLNYVSCSPFRVPIARLAAAQAALNNK